MAPQHILCLLGECICPFAISLFGQMKIRGQAGQMDYEGMTV